MQMSTSEAVTVDVFIEQMMAQNYLLANEDPRMHFYPIYSICRPSETSWFQFSSLIFKTI